MRDALGLDPYANAAADRAMVLTATGYVPIEANASPSPAGSTRRCMLPHGSIDCRIEPNHDVALEKYDPDQPRVPPGNSDGGQWTSEGGAESASTGDQGTMSARANQSECDDQYNRDIITCNLVGTPLCYAQAMERYAACLAGKPIPPLRF
jgi:hypothetical protein